MNFSHQEEDYECQSARQTASNYNLFQSPLSCWILKTSATDSNLVCLSDMIYLPWNRKQFADGPETNSPPKKFFIFFHVRALQCADQYFLLKRSEILASQLNGDPFRTYMMVMQQSKHVSWISTLKGPWKSSLIQRECPIAVIGGSVHWKKEHECNTQWLRWTRSKKKIWLKCNLSSKE